MLFGLPASPAGAGLVEHEVRRGDDLHLIAGYYYKDPRQWKRVWRENRSRVPNRNVLRVGARLQVPLDDGAAWEEIPYEEFVARVRRGR